MARGRTLNLKVETEVKGLDKLNKLGDKLGKVGANMTRNYTLPIIAAGVAVVKFASDLEEGTSKAQQVFTAESDRIIAAAENMDDAFSAATFLDTAGTFGALLQNMGFVEKEAADLSLAWLDLAQDMASFHNVDVDEALNAVRSALAGEFEPLKRFGVMLNVATIEAKALEMGLWDGTGAMDAQTRALVVNAELFRQQPKLLGDWERTQDGVANSTKNLTANLEDAAASLGKELLPFAAEFVGLLNDWVKAFADLDPEVKTWIVRVAAVVAATGPLLLVVGKLVTAYAALVKLAPAIGLAWPKLVPPIAVGLAIGALKDQIHELVNPDGPSYNEMFAASIGGIGEQVVVDLEQFEGQIAGWGDRSVRTYADAVGPLGDVLPDGLQAGLDAANEIAAKTPGSLASSLRENIDDYGDALDELTEIAAKSVSDLAERQEIEGILASQELTDALNSDSTRTRLLAMDLVNDLVADYELIAPGALAAGQLVGPDLASGIDANIGMVEDAAAAMAVAVETPLSRVGDYAYPWGYNVGDELARGMWDSKNLISDAAYALANTASNQLRIESEPPDHRSPLYGITKWGGNIAKTLADGMLGGVGVVGNAAAQMAGAVSMAPVLAGGGSGGAGGDVHVHLTVMGDLRANEATLPETIRRAIFAGGIG